MRRHRCQFAGNHRTHGVAKDVGFLPPQMVQQGQRVLRHDRRRVMGFLREDGAAADAAVVEAADLDALAVIVLRSRRGCRRGGRPPTARRPGTCPPRSKALRRDRSDLGSILFFFPPEFSLSSPRKQASALGIPGKRREGLPNWGGR